MTMRSIICVSLVALLGAGSALAQEDVRAGSPEPVQAAPKTAVKHKAKAVKKQPAKPSPVKEAKAPLPAPKPDAAKTAPIGVKVPAAAPKPDATKAAPKPEPAKAAARPEPAKAEPPAEAAAAIPPPERAKIQAALAWAGDFAGIAKGEDALTAAIKSFQKRSSAKVTGELTATQRADLLAAANNHEKDFGWSVVADPATGIRVGLPTKMMPRVQDAAHGTRWSSAHGEFQIETFRIKEADIKLATLFEREKANRKVENSALHDDSFLISGMQGLKYFSVRAQLRDGEVRGITIMYDQAWEGIVAAVTGAMVSAYAPFPERGAPYAALAKAVEYGTGLIVSRDGHIVTARRLAEGCRVIVAPGLGDAERVADDETQGLALLRVYGRSKLAALSFASDPPKTAELTLVGVPDPREKNSARALTEIKARLAGGAIELRQPVPVAGLSGAAALDAQGRVLGMMAMQGAMLASAGPAAASPVRLVSAGTIRDFLTAHHVPLATELEGDARNSVVRVICVRK